jgi:hypothetical protein
MNTIEINGKKYEYPESLLELKWDMYEKILLVQGADDINMSERIIKIFSILTGIEDSVVRILPYNTAKRVFDTMKFLEDIKNIEIKPPVNFVFNDIEYEVDTEFKNWNFRQYIDSEVIMDMYKDNTTEALPFILAVFAHPVGEVYKDSETVLQRGEDFKKLNVETILSVGGFFLLKKNGLIQSGEIYSRVVEEADRLQEHTENLIKNGDGISVWKRFRAALYLSKMKYYRKRLQLY